MRFGKRTMFALLQGLLLLVLLIHLGRWALGETTTAHITTPYSSSTLKALYTVDGRVYTGSYMRYDVPYGEQRVQVRYLPHRPSVSRIHSFMGIAAEALAWWAFLTLVLALLLLTHNAVFSRGTVFQVHRRFPWISMDEYFPFWDKWQSSKKHSAPPPPRQANSQRHLK